MRLPLWIVVEERAIVVVGVVPHGLAAVHLRGGHNGVGWGRKESREIEVEVKVINLPFMGWK